MSVLVRAGATPGQVLPLKNCAQTPGGTLDLGSTYGV